MALNRNKVLAAAQKYIRKGNWDKALREYQRLVDDDPGDTRSLLKIADLYVKLQRNDDAYDSYLAVANFYAEEGLYEKAVAVYKQALRVNEEEPQLHQSLGDAYHRLGRMKEAVRAFHHAQRIYRDRGDGIRQREVLYTMVQLDPQDTGLRIQLAECYAKDGLHDEALEHFGEAAERFDSEGRRDNFVQVSERILYLDAGRIELRKKLVKIYIDRKDNQHALKHLQHCFQQNPKDVETLDMLGKTFLRLKRNEKAVLVYAELAQIYQEQKFTGRATDVYRKILEIDPLNQEAKKALSAVRHLDESGALRKLTQSAAGMSPASHAAVKQTRSTDGEDALDGIEFLDDESNAAQDGQPAQSSGDAKATSSVEDYSGIIVRESLIQTSEAAISHRAQVIDASEAEKNIEIDGEIQELEPISEQDEKIKPLLAESEIFIKYGLHDMAIDVLQKAVTKAPQSLLAQEQLFLVYESAGKLPEQVDMLCKMARVVSKTRPDDAFEYLQRALSRAPDPEPVYGEAKALGIQLDAAAAFTKSAAAAPKATLSLEETSVQEYPGAADLLVIEEEEVEWVSDLSDAASEQKSHVPEPSYVEWDDLDDEAFGGLDEVTEVDHKALVLQQEITGHAHQMEGMGAEDSQVYEELFNESSMSEQISLGGEESIAGIAEVDFYIQQGFAEEADSALIDLERLKPKDKELDKRRALVQSLKNELDEFGCEEEHGLAQKTDTYSTLTTSFEDVVNTNLELGAIYRKMGMYDDAIEEFKQAADDPEAATSAWFNVALCEVEKGEPERAAEILRRLLSDPSLSVDVRVTIESKLNEITPLIMAKAQ